MINFKCWRKICNREQIDREIRDWEQIDREIRDWQILMKITSTAKFAIGSKITQQIDREIRDWETDEYHIEKTKVNIHV